MLLHYSFVSVFFFHCYNIVITSLKLSKRNLKSYLFLAIREERNSNVKKKIMIIFHYYVTVGRKKGMMFATQNEAFFVAQIFRKCFKTFHFQIQIFPRGFVLMRQSKLFTFSSQTSRSIDANCDAECEKLCKLRNTKKVDFPVVVLLRRFPRFHACLCYVFICARFLAQCCQAQVLRITLNRRRNLKNPNLNTPS